jgi:hypothetical protein
MDIPQLTFQSELVPSTLLGLSALHHLSLTPKDPSISYIAGYYFGKVVRNHRITLSNVDQSSAKPVLAIEILICHDAWLSEHNTSSTQPYEIPLQTYYMAVAYKVSLPLVC